MFRMSHADVHDISETVASYVSNSRTTLRMLEETLDGLIEVIKEVKKEQEENAARAADN